MVILPDGSEYPDPKILESAKNTFEANVDNLTGESPEEYTTNPRPFTEGKLEVDDDPRFFTSESLSNQQVKEQLVIDEFTNSRYAAEIDAALQSVAAGGYSNQMQIFLTGLDRFQRNILPTNSEHSGLTFITRPRLNLQSASLRQDRVFAPLDMNLTTSGSRSSMGYMIRCLLDTRFAKETDLEGHLCPLINSQNPFFTPLCNGLTGISGWPDPIIQTLTTDPGYHSEDQTFAIGHDDLNKTYDLNLSFKDIQHGPIAAIFLYWFRYIANVTKGTMFAYQDDIENRRLNYTVSIYRFVMDPTRRYITRFAKATGCFPKSVPIGAMFNFSEGELFLPAAGKFSIPFVANKIEYNDYAILQDFNYLVNRYCPDVASRTTIPPHAKNNYMGVPYIDTRNGELELVFKQTDDEIK